MTSRADRVDGRETQVVARSLVGGLDTKTPPHHVDPGSSPDLLNVTLSNRAVSRRGGFVPLIRERPGVGSLRNVGRRLESRSQRSSGAAQTTFLSVPGCGHAGHRPVWGDADVRNGLTLDLFLVIDDLTTSHGGNADDGTPTNYGPSPFTIQVRPILSKGPIKRFLNEAGHFSGTTGWLTTNRWGPTNNTDFAMPFCLYLFNNAGTWEIRLSLHVRRAGNWELVTVSSNLAAIGGVRTGVKYHVIAGFDIAAETARLRVGSWFDWGVPTYVDASTAIAAGSTAPAQATPTPIQLFDCPQEFIEAPAAASATRPPGLAINSAASGGYWFGSKRFQGTVEDIVIYRGLVANIIAGSLDRLSRIDPASPPATRLQHWPIGSLVDDMVEEVSGTGNNMVLVPSDPVFDKDGGIDGGALFFNGTTAYALAEMADVNPINGSLDNGRAGRACWRTAYISSGGIVYPGAWEWVVRNSLPHGLEVAFWAESIEPNNEQVVVEAHGVCRVVVGPDGLIRAYVRDAAAAPNGYVAVGASASPVVPGERYHVAVIRLSTTLAQLWVNGTLEVSNAGLVAPHANASPVSGLTIGAGALAITTAAQSLVIEDMRTADQINVDHRTHFFGRVECVRVLMGSIPFADTLGSLIVQSNRRARVENYTVPFHRLFNYLPVAGEAAISTTTDTVPNVNTGHVVVLPQVRREASVPLVIISTLAGGNSYMLHALPFTGQGGTGASEYQGLTIFRTIACYDFNSPVPEYGYTGNYQPRIEYTNTGAVDTFRMVHVHRGYVQDTFGMGGPIQLRCSESDFGSNANNLQEALRPYETASPRELAPQWSSGILRPPVDENPISFLADWRHETSGEQFLIAGCRRSIFWAKSMWRHTSPFQDHGAAMWMLGRKNEYARSALAAAAGAGWDDVVDVFDVWIYPTRLDGHRIIAMRGSKLNDTVRWLVTLKEGQLQVFGQLVGLNAWAWVHGSVAGGPTRNLAEVSVRLNQWNHLTVRIGDNQVMAWVNGQRLAMGNASLLYGTALIDSANIVGSATHIWLGGVSADQETQVYSLGGPTMTLTLKPYHGYMTAARESSSLANFSFTTTTSASPPTSRPVTSGSTRWCFPLNQTYGWTDTSLAGGITLDVNASEIVPIRTDLQDMGREAASAAVFRSRMLVAHKNMAPQAVRFIAFDVDTPFVSERLGIVQPGEQGYGYARPNIVKVAGVAAIFDGGENLTFYVSYYSAATDEESSPFPIGSFRLSAGVCMAVGLSDIPRSADPQVSARRIYLSVEGALPVYVGQLEDNVSTYFEIQTKLGLGLTVPDPRSRLPAPRAQRVALAPGVVLLANLEGNPNAFAMSGESAGYFPLDRQIAIDSQDGRGIVGAITHLSSIFLFKRNGTWAVSGAGVRPVNNGAGCGGGTSAYDNVVYGSGDRGVWMFDGSGFRYASDQLERAFEDVEVTEPGLLAQQGTYFYPGSQYWLSVRKTGDFFNETVYVLHTSAGGSPAWTRVDLPKHLALSLAADPLTDRPVLALGTSCGQILRLYPTSTSEGVPAAIVGTGAGSGKTLTTTSTGLWRDLRGVTIHIFSQVDGSLVAKSRITHNFEIVGPSTVFHVEHTLPSANLDFVIGSFDAYWSSAWIAAQQLGSFNKTEAVDLEFEPVNGLLRFSHATAVNHASNAVSYLPERNYDSEALDAEEQSVNMASGFLDQPVAIARRQQGRYFRFRLGTFVRANSAPVLFSVTSWGQRFSSVGTRGGPT